MYSAHVVAKSTTERQNSNDLYTANKSMPFNRAIFVCSTHTPKENNLPTFGQIAFLSMVACNGKGSPFAVFRVSQFLTPLHVTAQIVRSLAVAPEKSNTELSSMIYKFLLLGSQRLKITVHANNKAEALSRVQFASKPLLVARLRNPLVNNSANMTACDTEQNNSLPSVDGCGHNDLTTTYDANRKRDTSGLFLPQIHNHGITTPKIYSELAVRATPRNKALSTNKGGYSYVAVEPLSHLSQSDKSFYQLTKTYDTMKKPTQTGNTAKTTPIVRSTRFINFHQWWKLNSIRSPIALSSRFEGVQYV
ncbi:ash family protein [Mannheimia sp. ZY171111]|uniref:ash family protein n=1 Tax=Mannheimia sp. ZY171111 TaxID=2679995 RepID=UPI001EE1C377|nr:MULTISPECIES: ash family protein [Mannheimia]